MDSIISIKNLSKIYTNNDNKFYALKNVCLDIEKGDIFGIIGMSGAGKSTLVRCINKLDTPSDGQIYIKSKNILSLNSKELNAERKNIAMIFQSFNLLNQRSVFKNIRYPLEIAKVDKKVANDKVLNLLKLVGLEHKKNAYPSELSGGQKQRVAIARALASQPEILLCDEATSALDPLSTESILDLLKDINKTLGITIILITHEMSVIKKICNKVAILDNGELVEQGKLDDVFKNTKSKAGKMLFGITSEDIEIAKLSNLVRIIFDDKSAQMPIISKLIKKFEIDLNIISADIKRLNGISYGQMIVQLDNADTKEPLINYLRSRDILVEEV